MIWLVQEELYFSTQHFGYFNIKCKTSSDWLVMEESIYTALKYAFIIIRCNSASIQMG